MAGKTAAQIAQEKVDKETEEAKAAKIVADKAEADAKAAKIVADKEAKDVEEAKKAKQLADKAEQESSEEGECAQCGSSNVITRDSGYIQCQEPDCNFLDRGQE